MATATTSSAAAARPALRGRAASKWRAAVPRRAPSLIAHRCRAVPQDDDRSSRSGDPLASGLLGGADRDLADLVAGASAGDDPDAVVEALGMRANLLDADDEARARQRAMDNLGSLMASGQAGALQSVPPDLLPMLLRLPSTSGNVDALRSCAEGIDDWKASLARGLLPSSETKWPDDPVFREALLDALGDLDMARFTRQFPPVLDTLMKNILDILYVYEQQKVDEDGEEDDMPRAPQQDGGGSSENGEDGEPEDGDPEGDGGGGGDEGDDDAEGAEGNSPGGGGGRENGDDGDGNQTDVADIDFSMEGEKDGDDGDDAARDAAREAARERNKELVRELMEDFKSDWEPAVDKLDKAAKAFEGLDLDDLAEGPDGFDITKGLWQQTGWKELDSLRKKLEELRELRDLVRSLGRGAGRGPLRRAPRQRERAGMPVGLVRSPLEPEETNGLCRSDDISRMLPSEMALIANGSRPARLLHFARRVERTLLSYERVGWAEEPAVTTEGTEIRPAAECGPIILCLDTSGSMMGARETVAKAMVLECMRQAKSQQRQCYLYSFSGPGDCQELELKVTGKGVSQLLEFLAGSFHGGTDVDEPFIRALSRLDEEAWSNADILLVTDGEIRPPDEEMLADLNAAKEEMGLKVHGLLVGEPGAGADVVEALCTHTHTFKSWAAVKEAR
jgi:uncharacterized protein with von Willebrand factor type A (vWA) domain